MRDHLYRLVVTFGFVFLVVMARAATFTIADGDVAGLINAINTSNSNNQDDTINLNINGHYTLTVSNDVTAGGNGLPLIKADNNHILTINGNGATLQRSAAGGTPEFRILFILTGATVNISNLTIAGGLVEHANPSYLSEGGGIFNNHGTLTLTNCILSNNRSFVGGAIYVDGTSDTSATLVMTNCTVQGNAAVAPDGTSGGRGAGIEIDDAAVTLSHCTINGNTCGSYNGKGGGIYLGFEGSATVQSCTIVDNAADSGGGIYNEATLTVRNSTISSNDANGGQCIWTHQAIAGGGSLILSNNILSGDSSFTNLMNENGSTVTSDGYNLSTDDGSGLLSQSSDQIDTDPKLDPNGLQDNGGPTQTIALMAGSPAVDKGLSYGATTDQRGQTRPRDLPSIPNAAGGDGSDIGAFESIDPKQGGPILIVSTNADHDDGICGAIDCTLREAIAAANAATDANTITFAAGVTGTITLNSALGQLIVTTPTTIAGPGARILAVSGNSVMRVFNFTGGSNYVLSGLTIRDGASSSTAPFQASAGGLGNYGNLTVNDCAFVNNRATGGIGSTSGGSGSTAFGAGIYNFFGGTLIVNRCTFAGNIVTGGRGGTNSGAKTKGGTGGSAQGGGIFNDNGCSLTLANCTFSGNNARGGAGGNDTSDAGGDGGNGQGGGIYNAGTMAVTSCTLSSNSGGGGIGGTGSSFNDGTPGTGSGGLTNSSGTSTVGNTISAGNTGNAGSDASGSFTSQGYNLIGVGDFTTGFNATGDQVGTTAAPINAKLGSLANNGGPTDTLALLAGSPAIDQGKSFGLTTDQRSRTRPLDDLAIAPATGGDNSDIGAFESAGNLIPLRAVSRKTHGTSGLTFDVDLPLTGAVGVECRTGGATGDHQLVITFPSPVSVNGTPKAQITSGAGAIGTGGTANNNLVTVNGAVVTVPLTNVTNAQRVTVTLNSVSDGTNTNSVSIPMGVLLGDTTNDGSVNSGDIAQTKSKSGQTVDASNFRADVTVDLSLNSGDIALVKSKSGTALPP